MTFKEFGLLILCGWHNHPQLIVLIFVLKMSNIQIFNCQNNTNFPEEIEAYKDFSLQDRDGEVWKDIYDYEGLYQISNYGRVKSCKRIVKVENHPQMKFRTIKEKILKQKTRQDGHLLAFLFNQDIRFELYLSRAVWLHFNGDIPNDKLLFVNHKDENIKNNHISNLLLASSSAYRVNKYVGVHKRAKRYPFRPYQTTVILYTNKERITHHLGSFATELEAAQAYDDFIVKHNLKRKGNFIDNR